MPVTPHYSWEESPQSVTVSLAIPGFSQRRARVTLADAFLSVSHAPHLLAVDLFGEVRPAEAAATAHPDGLEICLPKAVPGLWGQLGFLGSREAAQARRQASLERLYADQRAAAEAHQRRRREADRSGRRAVCGTQWPAMHLHQHCCALAGARP